MQSYFLCIYGKSGLLICDRNKDENTETFFSLHRLFHRGDVMKKRLLILILLLFFHSEPASALSCAPPPPIDEAFQKYDGIIIGYVEKIDYTSDRKVLKVNVRKSFKGVQQDQIIIVEDKMWGESKEEEEYLYFLRKNEKEWEHPLCSPTKTINQASKELEYLKNKQEIPLTEMKPPQESVSKGWIFFVATAFLIAIATYVLIRLKKQR